jgi:hypothetical protein
MIGTMTKRVDSLVRLTLIAIVSAMSSRIHPTATIEQRVSIGRGTSIWDNVHIRHDSSIGDEHIPEFALSLGQPTVPVGVVCPRGHLLPRHEPNGTPERNGLLCPACSLTFDLHSGIVTERLKD